MDQMGAFLPLILIFGVFYILLIRPQQKKVKLHREMINNLKRGDKIITTGGIIGTITKVKDNKELIISISDNVEINIAPGMIQEKYISSDNSNSSPKTLLDKNSKDQNKGFLGGIFNKNKN